MIEEDNQMTKLRKYDRFLYGVSMIEQKVSKDVGNEITYYEVISKKENSVEYKPIYDVMEED